MSAIEKMVKVMQCSVGCDPEIFIANEKGTVIGAEHAIPKKGMNSGYSGYMANSKIVVDGVAVELNPHSSTCRAAVGADIKTSLLTLENRLKEKNCKILSEQVIKIESDEFEKMCKENQRLGCLPSYNQYDEKAKVRVTKANKYQRAAGGHIHLGAYQDPKVLVPILDLVCGNTLCLIDRDPAQAVRRKQYGRAGEYRLPSHGFEYRTPSNFWLRSPQLMGFAMQLCRVAMTISGYRTGGKPKTDEEMKDGFYVKGFEPGLKWLKANVDEEQVQEAINKNDFDLAFKNWKVLREYIEKFIPDEDCPGGDFGTWPLYPKVLDTFEFFVNKGLDHWWPNHYIVDNWRYMGDLHGTNWEAWLWNTPHKQYTRKETPIVGRNQKLPSLKVTDVPL